jgi:hypothetical protein
LNKALILRVKAVIKLEPTVDEILTGGIQGDQEYYDVLRFVYETTIRPDAEDNDKE